MVAPALVVGRGTPHLRAHRPRGQRRRRQLVVDAPSRVVVERLPAPRPPGVRTRPRPVQLPVHVDEAMGADPPVDLGLLLRQEARLAAVALPVLDVLRAVGDVEVPGQHGTPAVGGPRLEPLAHRREEAHLLPLSRGAGAAGVHVRRGDGHRDRTVSPGDQYVGLDPAARADELRADVGAHLGKRPARQHRHARAAGHGAPLVRQVPPLEGRAGKRGRELVVVGAHLLQRHDIRGGGLEPGHATAAGRGADAVDVGGDEEHRPMVASAQGTAVGGVSPRESALGGGSALGRGVLLGAGPRPARLLGREQL